MNKFFLLSIIIFCAGIKSSAQVIGAKEAGFEDGQQPKMDKPIRLCTYKNGEVLFVDFNNNAIRSVNRKGEVSTIVGGPDKKGYKDGPADQALFAGIHGVAYDANKDIIYIASASNNVVRKISDKSGQLYVETIAGNQAEKGFQDGEALSAKFNSLHQLLLGKNGEIYILDIGNAKVRMLKDGVVSTVAGNDDQSPLKADFKYPIDMAFDGDDIVICDAGNMNLYRLVLGKTVEKIATGRKLNMPHGISSNGKGELYIADMGANEILEISNKGDVSVIEDKDLNKPAAVLVDGDVLWVADLYNHQVKFFTISK